MGRDHGVRAAVGGHLEVLKWAREHGCEWDGRTIDAAQASGVVEIIQYVRANGCPTEYLIEGESEIGTDGAESSDSDE